MQKCEGAVPVAIDLYIDGWKISHKNKATGLYFTIANLDKNVNWKICHKFPVCLIPTGMDLQKILPLLLGDVKYTLPASEYKLSKYDHQKRNVKVVIARLIGDTPGIAEFCGTKNHRASEYQCAYICYCCKLIIY